MCSFIIGAFFLAVLLVGVFHGELSGWVMFVLIMLMLSAFGRSAEKEKKKKLLQEQLEYYEKQNQENNKEE